MAQHKNVRIRCVFVYIFRGGKKNREQQNRNKKEKSYLPPPYGLGEQQTALRRQNLLARVATLHTSCGIYTIEKKTNRLVVNVNTRKTIYYRRGKFSTHIFVSFFYK